MKTLRQRINWPAMALLGLLVGFVGYTVSARPAAPTQPTIVATVNLATVFNGLSERSAVDADMTKLAEDLDADAARQREEIEMLGQDIELYGAGTRQYLDTEKRIAKLTYQLRAYREFSVRKLELKKAQALHKLYRNIKEGAAMLATERGYDIVVMDDSIADLTAQGTEAEMWSQISARRMLFASPTIDVTEELITRMNTAFVQGG